MSAAFTAYAVLGLTILLLALAAATIKRGLWLSEPLVAMGVGLLAGPFLFDLLDPADWGDEQLILEELVRITLAISLMGVAFRLPDTWVRDYWRPLAAMLLLVMPLMWLVSSTLAWAVLGLPVLQALLLGAILTPTDPVVADSIVTGKLAEERIAPETRHLLSTESGANDGLAYLLVMLPVLLLEHEAGYAVGHWLINVLLGTVMLSIAGGLAAGWLTGRALKWVYKMERSHHGSILSVSLALAISLLGVAKLLHGDGILAVFAAGLALNWVVRKEAREEAQHERMQETTKRFFEVPVFVFFGLVLPWEQWLEMGAAPWALAAAVLLFRRLPAVILLRGFISPLNRWRDALFAGWFGPIAVAALLYATWADVHEHYEHLWIYGSLVIFCSICLHGITATPFTRLYSREGEEKGETAVRAIENR